MVGQDTCEVLGQLPFQVKGLDRSASGGRWHWGILRFEDVVREGGNGIFFGWGVCGGGMKKVPEFYCQSNSLYFLCSEMHIAINGLTWP